MSNPADGGSTASDAATGPPLAAKRRAAVLFPLIGLVVGACATLPVLLGPRLDVTHAVEVADHLVPGLVVMGISAVGLLAGRSSQVSASGMLGGGLVVVLAGLWMAATHMPLVAQAARHEAPWGATMYHSASAMLVLASGLAWTWGFWADAA